MLVKPHMGALIALVLVLSPRAPAGEAKRSFPYRDLEGTVEDFTFHRDWRSYYWREDFTLLVRDDKGTVHRVISREPTPWNNLRLGTTFPGLNVDWKARPRVRVIGVQGIDRIPAEFYGLKLEPQKTVTAFIVRVQATRDGPWKDYFINNWFHDWGADADRKILPHYATQDKNYTVYGYLNGIAAPFDAAGKELLKKYEPVYGGIIYHGRVVKAGDGYEVRLLHLLGRHKKTLDYDVFYGKAAELIRLDQKPPANR